MRNSVFSSCPWNLQVWNDIYLCFMPFNWKSVCNCSVCSLLRYNLQIITWFTVKKYVIFNSVIMGPWLSVYTCSALLYKTCLLFSSFVDLAVWQTTQRHIFWERCARKWNSTNIQALYTYYYSILYSFAKPPTRFIRDLNALTVLDQNWIVFCHNGLCLDCGN
jgi:hypothetical protein